MNSSQSYSIEQSFIIIRRILRSVKVAQYAKRKRILYGVYTGVPGLGLMTFLPCLLEGWFIMWFTIFAFLCLLGFCIKALIIRRYNHFPCASYTLWNIDEREDILTRDLISDSFQSFSSFKRIIHPLFVKSRDLKLLEKEILYLNRQLQEACDTKHKEVFQYLIGVCRARDNHYDTYKIKRKRQLYYSKWHTRPSIDDDEPYELLNIKELLRCSFSSDFILNCVIDIIDGQYDKYPFSREFRGYVSSNEIDVFE